MLWWGLSFGVQGGTLSKIERRYIFSTSDNLSFWEMIRVRSDDPSLFINKKNLEHFPPGFVVQEMAQDLILKLQRGENILTWFLQGSQKTASKVWSVSILYFLSNFVLCRISKFMMAKLLVVIQHWAAKSLILFLRQRSQRAAVNTFATRSMHNNSGLLSDPSPIIVYPCH